VVWTHKLWPRSLAPPPHTTEDVRACQLYAQTEVRQKDETVKVAVSDLPEDEKMPTRTEGAPAETAPPAVSAGTARGEDSHDCGDDR
jgi:hypothetical protein